MSRSQYCEGVIVLSVGMNMMIMSKREVPEHGDILVPNEVSALKFDMI